MLKEERLTAILNTVKADDRVLLGHLSAQLSVSEDTIRRDIKELENRGLLKAVRGGAVINTAGSIVYNDRVNYAKNFKALIGKKALSLIKENQTIIFDDGTSALAVASQLPQNIKLTVFTNSFPIAQLFHAYENIQVIFAGGRLCRSSYATQGHETISFFKNVKADLYFMGICCIDQQIGVTNYDYEESLAKSTMVAAAVHVVALATFEKLNTKDPYFVCDISQVNTLITDLDPTDELLKPYHAAGLKVV